MLARQIEKKTFTMAAISFLVQFILCSSGVAKLLVEEGHDHGYSFLVLFFGVLALSI